MNIGSMGGPIRGASRGHTPKTSERTLRANQRRRDSLTVIVGFGVGDLVKKICRVDVGGIGVKPCSAAA